jgi:transcriptional regulator PpsR
MPPSPRSSGKPFDAPARALVGLDAATAAAIINAASDVALILDRDGVIRDVAFGSDDLMRDVGGNWLGQPWAGTATVETRAMIESLLRDAAAKAPLRWGRVDHPSPRGDPIPVEYAAVPFGSGGRIVAMGRDLRPAAAHQQRLAQAQQAMERDYVRLRHAETRYRLLFELVSEAVLVVDATTLRVVEANPASPRMLGDRERHWVGLPFLDAFAAESTPAIEAMLATVRTGGRADDVNARLAGSKRRLEVAAQLVRHETSSVFLVRLAPQVQDSAPANPTAMMLAAVVAGLPDAFVVTDSQGRILAANTAFVDLAQLATEERARGESLERWLGRPGVDLNVMLANLRQYGVVRLFATTVRGEHGSEVAVEISAVAVSPGKQPCLGFTIRDVGRRLRAGARAGGELPRSMEQVTERVGRVPLKELVQEATDLIERMCIESALELTHDNRARAAEMLGLSRQSLYVKLRKYGIGDLADGGG